MSGEVVPFGKYRGQPVEAMTGDRAYVDWLTAQPWFREKYQNIYTLIVNNYHEPTETPQHNRLQVMFLDEVFRKKVFAFAFPESWAKHQERVATGKEFPGRVLFEQSGFDVYFSILSAAQYIHKTLAGKEELHWGDHILDASVEIKPSVGDDYPAVLRQMKSAMIPPHRNQMTVPWEQGWPILFLEHYSGVGATEDQFIAIFEAEGIKVVFLDEVS